MSKQTISKLSLVLIFVLFSTNHVAARQNSLSGTVTATQGYESNIHRVHQNEQSEWTTTISPALTITSQGIRDNLFLRYTPGLVYSNRTSQERVDHNLLLTADRDLIKNFNLAFTNTFIRAEEPHDEAEIGIQLADRRGQNRYWTNRAAVDLKQTFGRNNFWQGGYIYQILDHNEINQDDYNKHNPHLSITYSFTPQWQTAAAYSFTKGNFDQSDDLTTNAADLKLNFNRTKFSTIFSHYSWSATNYDGTMKDYIRQSLSIGLDHALDTDTSITLASGISTVKRERAANHESFFYNLTFDRRIKDGVIKLTGSGGFDQRQFDGTIDTGLSRYWSIKGNLNYRLDTNLASNIYLTYRHDKYLERQPKQDEEMLTAGASLTWTFARWYSISINYLYSQLSADVAADEYDNNQLFLQLKTNRDILKW